MFWIHISSDFERSAMYHLIVDWVENNVNKNENNNKYFIG